MSEDWKQQVNQMVDGALEAYRRTSVELTNAGYLPEIVIQAALAQAAGDAIAFGYCHDAMQEYLARLYVGATCGQAKCPHCNGTEAKQRS